MRRNGVGLVGIIVDPFMGYIAPQLEDSFSSSRYGTGASKSAFNSETLCLLIFVFALALIAVISPILCFTSLFINLHLEGLWYFGLITLSETGYLVWRFIRKKEKKSCEDIYRANRARLKEIS